MKLTFDTIEELNTTNSVSVLNMLDRVPIARITYNARNSYVIGGYNIKSVTETAAGRYTVLFTRPVASKEFAVIGAYMDDATTAAGSIYVGGSASTATDYDRAIYGFTLVELPRDVSAVGEPIRIYAMCYGRLADE